MAEITRVKVYCDNNGEWRWIGYAANGEAIAESTESYTHKHYASEQGAGLYPDAELEVVEPVES